MDIEKVLSETRGGTFTTGPDRRIEHWSRGAEQILGYSAREAVGQPCDALLVGPDGDRGACQRSCNVAGLGPAGEAEGSFNIQTRTKTGIPIWVHVNTFTVPNGAPASEVTVHLFQDVTAIREAVAQMREECVGSPAALPASPVLTRRELEILRMVAAGFNTKSVAETLHVSPATVRNHVQNILGKLGAHSRLQAVAHATRRRLL